MLSLIISKTCLFLTYFLAHCYHSKCAKITGIKGNFICLEAGCRIGTRCNTKGMEESICCPYIISSRKVTCCLKIEFEIVTTVKALRPTGFQKCGNLKLLWSIYHCQDNGCQVGSYCITKEYEPSICCPHLIKDSVFTCCSEIVKEITIAKTILPSIFYPTLCVEVGCTEGDYCFTPKLFGKKCSRYLIGIPVTCCSTHNAPLTEHLPFCETSLEIPERCYCMEIGCSLGHRCTTRGLESQICCPRLVNNVIVSCCLAKDDSTEIFQSNTKNILRGIAHNEFSTRKKWGRSSFPNNVSHESKIKVIHSPNNSHLLETNNKYRHQKQLFSSRIETENCPNNHFPVTKTCTSCKINSDCPFSRLCCSFQQWWGMERCCKPL